MGYTHDSSWQCFEKILKSKLPVRKSWKQLIDFHKKAKIKPYWVKISDLVGEIEKEQNELVEWLEKLVSEEPLSKKIRAFYIGIGKHLNEDTGKEFYAIYIAGCEKFDPIKIEWAEKQVWVPENNYLIIETINNVDAIVKKYEEKQKVSDYSLLDWILPLALTSFLFDDLIRKKIDKKKFLKHQENIHVVAGFDSGDFMPLSPIKK